jgi:hypothetical protein
MGNKQTGSKKTDSKQTGSKKSASTKTKSTKTASKKGASRLVTNKTLPPHRRRCIIIKDAKHRGEWTELIFMSRVTERGFNASKPWGDSTRYDVAVERGGHFLRVQVKSTIARQDGGYVCAIKSSRCQYYTRNQVDFFAVYVIPEDVWYILPAKIIIPLRGHFLLNPRRPRQKYAPYKEAWHLLKTGCHKKSRRADGQAAKACSRQAAKRRKNAAPGASRGRTIIKRSKPQRGKRRLDPRFPFRRTDA